MQNSVKNWKGFASLSTASVVGFTAALIGHRMERYRSVHDV